MWFSEGALADPEVQSLADRIELVPNQSAAGGSGRDAYHAPAEARVHARGRKYRARVALARGEAARPLSSAQRRRKFLRLASCHLSEAQAMDVAGRLDRLEQESSLRDFAQSLTSNSVARPRA